MTNNKMNIDMGDFFGGGDPQPAKKDTKSSASRFGFGGFAIAKKPTANGSVAKRGSAKGSTTDEDYENPMDFGVQQSLRNTPPKSGISGPPVPSMSLSSQSPTAATMSRTPMLGAKPAPRIASTESKLQPQSVTSAKAAPETVLKPPLPPNTPVASPIILASKSSTAKLAVVTDDTKQHSDSNSIGLVSPTNTKVPPPLPPRPLSPKGSSKVLKTVSDVSPPKNQHSSPPANDQVQSSAAAAMVNTEAVRGVPTMDSAVAARISGVASNEVPPPQRTVPPSSAQPALVPPLRKISLAAGAKPSGSGILSLDPTKAERTEELRPEIAPWTVFSEDPEKTLANEELRSAVAPWTVFSEDPAKTLVNGELRSQVAPWTSEPDPEPMVREPSTGGQSDMDRSPVDNKVIGMGAFFSNSDSNMDDDDIEFENPFLSGNPKTSADEDEMISKPSIAKKSIFGARPSQVEIKKAPASPIIAPAHALVKVPEQKKVIDYGEVFKSPKAANDDEDSFMNDPEFRDAPEFEW